MIRGMSCLAIIRSARDDMSANEKKLADFILENAPLIRDYSSQQIAASVGVSQSSVVKFSQKIGYKGFTDLKLAIHESVIKQGANVALLQSADARDRSVTSPREELYRSKSEALLRASELNDERRIDAAVSAIALAGRVQVIGVGNAYIASRDLSLKLMTLGKAVIAEGDAHLQLSGVATLTRGDCLVACSDLGQEPALIQIVRQAKKTGVAIVSMTGPGGNPVSALADVRLYTASAAADSGLSAVLAAVSRQHVVDLVYFALVSDGGRISQAVSGRGRASDVS